MGEHLYDVFTIKKGFKQSPLLFNFALEYTVRTVHVNQESLKLNGTDQLLVYDNDVHTLGQSVCTIKKTQKL